MKIRTFPTQMDKKRLQDLRKFLNESFENVFNKNILNDDFKELYRSAHTMVLHQHGELLYNDIRDAFTKHLSTVLLPKVLEASNAENLLSVILECWKNFSVAVIRIRDVVMFLERVYIQQQRRDLPGVWDLGVQLFRDNIVVPIKDELQATMLNKVKMNRDNNQNEWTDLKAACTMLLQLELHSRNFYEEVFEIAFLQTSAEYYCSLRNEYLADNDETVFNEKIKRFKKLEKERVDCFLDEKSKIKLMKILNTEFYAVC